MGRQGRRLLRTLVAGATATILAVSGAAAATIPAPTNRTTTTIAAASTLAPGTITTVAGSAGWGPSPATNTAIEARDLARWGSTLYVADGFAAVVRAIDLNTGTQRVIAGTGAGASTGDGGPASAASFTFLSAIAVSGDGVLYVLDATPAPAPGSVGSFRIRRIGTDGIITSLPGTPEAAISSLATTADGALLIGDDGGGRVYKVANGTSTIIAGTASPSPFDPPADGKPATEAQLDGVWGVTETPDGQIYVSTSKVLRRIDAAGIIHTVAAVSGSVSHKEDGHLIVTAPHAVFLVSPEGSVTFVAGVTNASGPLSRFYSAGVADAEDRLLLASMPFNAGSGGYSLVERIEPDGVVTTIAGTGTPRGGVPGPTSLTQFVARDVAAMPDGSLVLLADDELWRIGRDGTASVMVPHAVLTPPHPDPTVFPAAALTVDARGTVYAAVGAVVWRIDTSGAVRIVAGTGSGEVSGDGGPAVEAGLGFVADIAVGPAGELFISDAYDRVIRKVTADGTIRTIAGTLRDRNDPSDPADLRQTGDGGPAIAATFVLPAGLALDHAGNLFVLDGAYNPKAQPAAVRRIGTDGVVTRVIAEGIETPIAAIALDSADNLLFATGWRPRPGAAQTCECQVLRRKAHGVVEVIAGRNGFAPLTSTGDGGRATDATFVATMITVDASDDLFLLDAEGTRVREVVAIGAPRDIVAAAPAAPVVAAAPFTG